VSAAAILDAPSVKTWPQAKLADVAELVNGGTPKSNVAEFWNGEHQWLTPADMGKMAGREIARTPRTITAMGLAKSSARLAPPSSVILSTRAPIGHLAINAVPMAFNQGCRALVLGPKLDHVFLYYFLLHSRELLNDLGTGTTFKELSATSLKTVQVPIPPLEEQKRIVAVLDQAFAALDRARALAEANLADAEEFFDSWASDAFRLESGDQPTVYLPDISENLDRLRVPITKADRKPGDVPYYGASGEVDRVADFIFDEDLLLVSEDGANLLARTYPIAFSISGKSWVNNHAHVLRFENPTDQEFVRLYLNSIPLDDFVSGMAQPKLNQKALNSIPIPFPPDKERARIVEKAAEISAASVAAMGIYGAQLIDVAELRQSLLQRAFAGELT
jgi:type I restriction enzyme S subunit